MTIRINGWRVMAHPLMIEQLLKLISAAHKVKAEEPANFEKNANMKLLASLTKLMFIDIPGNPQADVWRQGKTLGDNNKHWRRAKFAAGRFRLFFRYSASHQMIIFAWVNDSNSLRTYGSKTDAYRVFRNMLDDGNPPSDWTVLMRAAEAEHETFLGLADEAQSLTGKG